MRTTNDTRRPRGGKPLWVVFSVWRGHVNQAELFHSEPEASRRFDELARETDPRNDDLAVFEFSEDGEGFQLRSLGVESLGRS